MESTPVFPPHIPFPPEPSHGEPRPKYGLFIIAALDKDEYTPREYQDVPHVFSEAVFRLVGDLEGVTDFFGIHNVYAIPTRFVACSVESGPAPHLDPASPMSSGSVMRRILQVVQGRVDTAKNLNLYFHSNVVRMRKVFYSYKSMTRDYDSEEEDVVFCYMAGRRIRQREEDPFMTAVR